MEKTVKLTDEELDMIFAGMIHMYDEYEGRPYKRHRHPAEADCVYRATRRSSLHDVIDGIMRKITAAAHALPEPPVGTFEPWQFQAGGWGLF